MDQRLVEKLLGFVREQRNEKKTDSWLMKWGNEAGGWLSCFRGEKREKGKKTNLCMEKAKKRKKDTYSHFYCVPQSLEWYRPGSPQMRRRLNKRKR